MNRVKLLLSAVAFAAAALVWTGCNDGGKPVKSDPGTGTDAGGQALNAEWKLLKNGSSNQSLVGTDWEFLGFVDINTGATAPNLVCVDENCHALKFKADGAVIASSPTETFNGTYTVESIGDDVVYKIRIANFAGGDETINTWRTIFPTVTTFALQEDELRLFYNADNGSSRYLLFKPL